MGVDIHMYICRKGKPSKRIFDDGYRDYEWFDNLCQNGDDEYDHLPVNYGMSPFADEVVQEDKEGDEDGFSCYNFHYMSVGLFKKWFLKYRPDKKAGWFTAYEKWKIENKGYIPDDPMPWKSSEYGDDQYFVEYEDPYDSSKRLYDYLVKNKISNKADITYHFDH